MHQPPTCRSIHLLWGIVLSASRIVLTYVPSENTMAGFTEELKWLLAMRKFLSLYPYSESIHWPVDSAGLFKYLNPIDFWASIQLWLFSQEEPENEWSRKKCGDWQRDHCFHAYHFIVRHFCGLQEMSNPWSGRDLPF